MKEKTYLNSDYVFDYNHYKQSVNPKKTNWFFFAFLIIILLSGIHILINPRKIILEEFYFIEIDNFQTYSSAQKLASEINLQQGAGFIFYDGKYHVLASFYSDKNQAKTVLNNLISSYENATIFTLSAAQLEANNSLSNEQNNGLKIYINETNSLILQLEKLSINFIKKEISFNQTSVLLKELMLAYSETYSNFINIFNHDSKYNTSKKHADSILKSLSTLINCEEENLTTSFRYELISIATSRYHLLRSF